MRRHAASAVATRLLVGLALGVICASFSISAEAVQAPRAPELPPVDGPLTMLLGAEFPIQVNVSRPAALLHWLDSLAALRGPGVTAGKTVPVHREAFRRAHGKPTTADNELLRRYVELRQTLATEGDGRRSVTFTECFVSATSVSRAVSHCSTMLPADERAHLAALIAHYDARFDAIWRDGRIVREFLARVNLSPRRSAVAGFLVELAAFYGVPASVDPPPRVLLAPVPFGGGTHAQALGRFLLIEVRPGEGLFHEIPPIVHETAHFLEQRLPESRRRALRQAASAHGAQGLSAWSLLHEALPTALAQGVAGERFQEGFWSIDGSWYHRESIDRYAKRIFPIVREALDAGRGIDAALVDALVRAHPAVGEAQRSAPPTTPR